MSEPIERDQMPEERRAETVASHEAPVRAEGAGRGRRTRLLQLGVVAALVVAVIFAIVLATGGSGHPRVGGGGLPVRSAEREIDSLLAGIPQRSNTLGKATAPVTLRWFGDLECPYCKEFALGALPSLIGQWVRSGQLKIEYFSMETATRDPKVFKSQEVAALAAGMQNKLWNYIETFYHEQGEEGSGYVTEKYLHGLAAQVAGLNESLWSEDRYNPQLTARLAEELRVALLARFTGTPAFLISRQGGGIARLSPRSLASPKEFNSAIERLLNARRRPAELGYVRYLRRYFPSRPRWRRKRWNSLAIASPEGTSSGPV